MSLVVRRCERADMARVVQLLNDNLSSFLPPPEDYDQIWNEYHGQPNVHDIVVCDDGELVGYGAVVIEIKIRGGRMAHVESIVVASSHQRKGVGRKLMNELLSIASNNQCFKMVLVCQPHNVGFYQAVGYRADGHCMTRIL